jgi:glycine/D-amino acid oxidase-like deaminating enzyme
MAGRTYRSIWSVLATAGSQDGGVAATQPSALVTRPICSWTSTCCSEGQRDEIGTDSGFTEQAYLLPCFTEADVAAARGRMAMQAALGVPVRWLDPAEVDAANPTLAPGQTLGGTFCDQDGFIAPPRNVAAYTVALIRSGVDRFDEAGRSRLATDPIALPFPERIASS